MTKAAVLFSDDALMALQDERGHADVLTILCGRALQENDPYQAFICADRRCRIGSSKSYHFILRGEALKRLGFEAAAAADLERALELDPTDPIVNGRLIAAGHDRSRDAARWIVGDPRSGSDAVAQAVRVLHADGAEVVGRIVVEGRRLNGWVAWRGQRGYELEIVTTEGPRRVPLRRRAAVGADNEDAEGRLTIDHVFDGGFVDLIVLAEDRRVQNAVLAVRVNPGQEGHGPAEPAPAGAPANGAEFGPAADGARLITVVVPVYDDVEVTRSCLDALARQASEGLVIRVILVDDAAPSSEMSALLVDMSLRHGFSLLVNRRNLGFIGAVNRALDHIPAGDVLLLNSDVVLSRGAVAKLSAAAHARPGIGIVNPLTNNGQFNSFPSSTGENAFESGTRIDEIDAIAGGIGAGQVVATPAGIGYCMYVTRACLEAVGKVPEVYLRGYYEDVEFCLRAMERGFSSVCAVDVYVGHKGTASFKGEKARLVARNERALLARFPAHEMSCETFRRADPLREARGAIEAAAFPVEQVDVVVAGSSIYAEVLTARAEALRQSNARVLVLSWTVSNGATVAQLRPAAASEPLQIDFEFHTADVQADLVAAIERLRPGRIEMAGSAGVFGATLTALIEAGLEFGVLLCESLGRSSVAELDCPSVELAEPCAACLQGFDRNWTPQGIGYNLAHSLQHGDSYAPALIVSMDAMAQEVATDLASDVFRDARFEPFVAAPAERRARRGPSRSVLALLCPEPDLATERLMIALAGAARQDGSPWFFVVVGRGLGDRRLMSIGNLFVTGSVDPAECAELLDHYGAAALFAPQRWRGYGVLTRLAAELDLPKAYFDWSIGAVPAQGSDLAIDPRVCDAKAAAVVCAWLTGTVSGRSA